MVVFSKAKVSSDGFEGIDSKQRAAPAGGFIQGGQLGGDQRKVLPQVFTRLDSGWPYRGRTYPTKKREIRARVHSE
jgi:hypothetical protein